MFAAVLFALSHCHTTETFLPLDEILTMITVRHMFGLFEGSSHENGGYLTDQT